MPKGGKGERERERESFYINESIEQVVLNNESHFCFLAPLQMEEKERGIQWGILLFMPKGTLHLGSTPFPSYPLG